MTRGSEFSVFAQAPCVRFLRVPQLFSRAELARLEEIAKEWGAKGLAYLLVEESGDVRSPIAIVTSASSPPMETASPKYCCPLVRGMSVSE